MEVNRPAQKHQASRKGKKAWRKNIDIDEVEQGLGQKREDLRLLGTEESIDGLFTVDTTGDEKVKSKYAKEAKVLRSSEILQQRSKAPALVVERNNKKTIQGVSKKEVHRLMKLAGRVQGESQTNTIMAKQGLVNTKAHDIWGDEPSGSKKNAKKNKRPEFYDELSVISMTKPTYLPKTLNEAPIHLKANEFIAHEGKSYNPSVESWKQLIDKEFKTEKEKEDQRILLEKEKLRIQHLIENFDDNGELSSDDDDDKDEEDDEDVDEEDEESKESNSLSINAPTQRKIKTKAERNKEKRTKVRNELESELKALKAHIKELEKLPEIVEKVDQQEPISSKDKKRKAKLFKYNNIEPQLEVKLSNELTDSLRTVRPEGNLFYDQMMNFQNSGKVEARKTIYKKRKYSPKITEKWTYKDFK